MLGHSYIQKLYFPPADQSDELIYFPQAYVTDWLPMSVVAE